MERSSAEKEQRRFCSQYSRDAGEDMSGTVKPVDLWLLVEHRGRWPRHAITVFSDESRRRLDALRSRVSKLRIALIRKPERKSGPLSAFWAFSRASGAQLFKTKFLDYEELLFDPDLLGAQIAERLFAVCTHGTHDLCCAQFGNKVYAEMCKTSEHVWQVSHIGGCRFAPNVVCLPHGLIYGRVEQTDCSAIISTYEKGTVFDRKLRGRSCYPKSVQAAEYFLREATHMNGIEDLRLVSLEYQDKDRCSVAFVGGDQTHFRVSLCIKRDQADTYKSCSAISLEPRERFALVGLDQAQDNSWRVG